jgi:hypothetical protein
MATERRMGYTAVALVVVGLLLGGSGCLSAQQKTANYIATSGNRTNRLQITVVRNVNSSTGYDLKGYFDVSVKQSDGTTTSRHIAITGEVSTEGVPSAIAIPSSEVGVPDLTLGCFFDRSLNLQLVGDNRRSFPRIMYLVRKGDEGQPK